MRHKIIISLLVCLAVWAVFSWPLPKYVDTGIPASWQNSESQETREMIPGDHLQLLYQFQLVRWMIHGDAPWFYNVYEFNTGDDQERHQVKAYYQPFSTVYALLAYVCSEALAWNITSFLCLWVTYLFTWFLTRRYTEQEVVAACCSVVGIIVTYRWIALFGGSPTGFAMMWVPALWYGIDVAVRDLSWKGGVWVGVAIFFAAICDSQFQFMAMLSAPCWLVVALWNQDRYSWRDVRTYWRIVKAFLPSILFLVPSVLYSIGAKARLAGGTAVTKSRSIEEVAIFSPHWHGLFNRDVGVDGHIYIGVCVVIIATFGLLCAFEGLRANFTARVRSAGTLLLIVLGVIGIILLALGVNSPFEALFVRAARKVIPMYELVRQPAKVFSLMPTLLAMLWTVALSIMHNHVASLRFRRLTLSIVIFCVVAEYWMQARPHISLLDSSQGAYEAVAEDASERGVKPRVLIAPLWPGDDTWSSLYQYYVSLYAIRMVNGYHPTIKQEYYDDIFLGYSSVNKGQLRDEQIDGLRDMGIDYVMLHEYAFPEKVSPFPVAVTLDALLRHPRLELLAEVRGVWAFRILDEARRVAEETPRWPCAFPSRRWEPERTIPINTTIVPSDPTCLRGLMRFDRVGGQYTTKSTSAVYIPAMTYLVRARGKGALRWQMQLGDEVVEEQILEVTENDWDWHPLDVPPFVGHERVQLSLIYQAGSVDVDTLLLVAGDRPQMAVGDVWRIPAPCFFHAGYTDLEEDEVVLLESRSPNAVIFYGPRLPLDVGTYQLTLHYQSDAEEGTDLGRFNYRKHDRNASAWVHVLQGQPATAIFKHEHNFSFEMGFLFERAVDVRISSVDVTRME